MAKNLNLPFILLLLAGACLSSQSPAEEGCKNEKNGAFVFDHNSPMKQLPSPKQIEQFMKEYEETKRAELKKIEVAFSAMPG